MGKQMRYINVGVIGCGPQAELGHLPAYQYAPGVRIVAVSDIDEKRLSAIAKKFNVKKTYIKYEDLLQKEKEIELVSICLPTYLHRDAVVLASEFQKHILCEKPLALTIDGGREMLRSVEKNDVQLYLGYSLRFSKIFNLLKRDIEENFIGELISLRGVYQIFLDRPKDSWHWKRELGGGALADCGTHIIDLLFWLFGDIKPVSSRLRVNYPISTADIEAEIDFLTESKVPGKLKASWRNEKQSIFIKSEGQEGVLSADFSKSTYFIYKKKRILGKLTKGIEVPRAQIYRVDREEIWELIRCLQNDSKSARLATGCDGLKALEFVSKAYNMSTGKGYV